GTGDQHTVTIDWGDGSTPAVLTLDVGARTFTASHRYDSASKGGPDQVQVTVADDHGGTTKATADVIVRDVAPTGLTIDLSATTLNEGQSLTLTGNFSAPAQAGTQTVTIDWGDGSAATTLTLAAQVFTFQATHVYDNSHPDGKPVSDEVI